MDQYIALVESLSINGEEISDFKTLRRKRSARQVDVNLMNKTGRAKITPRYEFALGYVPPAGKPEYDFASLEDATFSIVLEGGAHVTFTDVNCKDPGDGTIDGEKAEEIEVTFFAGGMVTA